MAMKTETDLKTEIITKIKMVLKTETIDLTTTETEEMVNLIVQTMEIISEKIMETSIIKNNYNGNNYNRRPLDEKGIEKNIKNIMAVETVEKEVVRDYSKNIDKQKFNNKFDDNKNKKSKSRRNESNFDEGKLKSLKQTNKLSNMFEDQDGGMLDYYDLTTQRGRKGKKKQAKMKKETNKKYLN